MSDIIREALELYANEANWREYEDDQGRAHYDRQTGSSLGFDEGDLARKALAALDAIDKPAPPPNQIEERGLKFPFIPVAKA